MNRYIFLTWPEFNFLKKFPNPARDIYISLVVMNYLAFKWQ